MARPKKKYEFWDVVYISLVLNKENKYLPEYREYRFVNAYPVGSDLKVYEQDSVVGLDFAKFVAKHFDLDIVFGSEGTKNYAIVKIPDYLVNKIYNDDYEE